MKKISYLKKLFNSDKPLIIYKCKNGFELYTDFSEKIFLNKNNINKFLNNIKRKKYKNKKTDLYIGFFGYEILCSLINVKIPKQKNLNFPKSIFYKPTKKIEINYKMKDLLFNRQIQKQNKKFNINIGKNKYKSIFNKFIKKIKIGETYQIKICTKYKNKTSINSIQYFWKLMQTNLAPESFIIRDKKYSIISCSPENLINKKGKYITTKPIAGTLKKNKKISKFKALNFFKKNIKETKEHNMIVDMERSDLSKICVPGTVKILNKKTVEEYKDLFHYVSLIGGKLNKNVTLLNIIKAMMPGGSVIGCPKISTLNLLNSQEKESRNIFTGSFGYIKFNGDMRFNVIIRAILNFKNYSEISVASGVVVDSNPNHEFNENFIKAKSLIDLYK